MSYELLLAESRMWNDLVEEGFWDYINYGVTERGVDTMFGGRKKLEMLVKNELKKKYSTSDVSKIDPKVLEREIKEKSDFAARQLMKKEFLNGLKQLIVEGLLNGLINAFVNSLISFIFSLSIKKALEGLISGFISGVLIKFLYKSIELLYIEFKKRILQDPYAEPSFGEKLAITLLAISSFAAGAAIYVGAGVQGTAVILMINLVLNALITVIFNFSKIKQMLGFGTNT